MNEDFEPMMYLGVIFLVILFVGSVFEIGLLIYGYTHADTVHCNFIFCEFTTTRTTSESRIERITVQNCYLNGEAINCTGIEMLGTVGTAQQGKNNITWVRE